MEEKEKALIRLLKKFSGKLKPELIRIKELEPLRFKCLDGCVDCCKGHIVFIPETNLHAKLKERNALHPWPIDERQERQTLRRDSQGYCILLKDGLCSMQDEKPLACRAYPIYLDPLTKQVYVDIKCPGVGKGRILPQRKIDEMIIYRRVFWKYLGMSEEEKRIVHEEFFLPNIKK